MPSTSFDILITELENLANNLDQFDRKTLDDQGHRATGRLINSLKSEVNLIGNNRLELVQFMESYGRYVDTGFAFRIGITRWLEVARDWGRAVQPGLDDEQLTKFLSAVWSKARQEAKVPTSGSLAFSKTGERTNWIKNGDSYADEKVNQILTSDRYLNALLNEVFRPLEELSA